MQLLVQPPGKFMSLIWNLGTETYQKFETLRLFFKIFKEIFKNVKKIEKI